MKSDPIVFIAMRTWGELGNMLAARTLAREVGAGFGPVHLIEAEDHFPGLARAGEAIRQIVMTDEAPVAKRLRYMRVMEQLDAAVTKNRDDIAAGVEDLGQQLAAMRPRLVVGMKGLIARLALAATRDWHPVPVVSYVTNPGLLELPIHRCAQVWTFVPFERNQTTLVHDHGFRGERVIVVGKLLPIAGRRRSAPASAPAHAPARAILLANRGGARFRRLVDEHARRMPGVELSIITLHDPELGERVENHRRDSGVAHWHVRADLPQAEYLDHVQWLLEGRRPVLISKSGPNTMLEAASFGVPVVLLDSGLPMEAWVSRFVAEAGIGTVVEHEAEALEQLLDWQRAPQDHEACRRRSLELARELLDQGHALRSHRAAFAAVLTSAIAHAHR